MGNWLNSQKNAFSLYQALGFNYHLILFARMQISGTVLGVEAAIEK